VANNYTTYQSTSTMNMNMTSQYPPVQPYGKCKACCEEDQHLDNRGLCLNKCSSIVPNHIPEGQHKRYRDRIVLGKLPNT
jgi:hypothetical protein